MAMDKSEYSLSIKGLTFGYKQNIFEDFDLSIKHKEIVSIVGSSGRGKSTLLDIITGEIKPKMGDIRVGKISQIYQDPYTSFHPSYSIIEQIMDCVDELFDISKVGISIEILNKKPYELSGGQLQRASILRAISMKPDILLADEPTSALDNMLSLDIGKTLISLGCSILLVTHDIDFAKWCSDRIVYL
jgi:peptide/nickel transport system ATP-binding protein